MESWKGAFVEMGMKISHEFLGGEHHYKVDGVSIHSGGGPAFARKGDMLTMINGNDLANIAPEELAHLLTNGNPKLTVHQATRKKEPSEHCYPEKDALHPFKKELAVLSFSMEMRREEELGQGESGIGVGGCGEEGEEGGRGEDGMGPVEKENGEEEGDGCGVLVVKLTNTSFSVVKGRGSHQGHPSLDCHGTGCTLNEVIMVANSSSVTKVPGNTASFMQHKMLQNIYLENAVSQTYLRSICMENILFASPNPERMTIYFYKTNVMDETFRGMPVVLNFTDSQHFLKCCRQEGLVHLRVEAYEKQRLKLICKQDESALAFLFYMKGTMSGERKFESALCPGWFIQVMEQETVQMAPQSARMEEPSVYFIIVS
ncbi:unnamed protein product [Lota lota]